VQILARLRYSGSGVTGEWSREMNVVRPFFLRPVITRVRTCSRVLYYFRDSRTSGLQNCAAGVPMCCVQGRAMPFHRPSALTVISGHWHALLTTAGILPRIRWSAIDRYQVMPHGFCLVRELIDVLSEASFA